jgi:cyanophycin synthetase
VCPREDEVRHFYPLVLKPVAGSQGRGVKTDIQTYEHVRHYWSDLGEKDGLILVEELVTGVDLRCCVVGGKLIAAASRVNAHVIGDGKTSIAGLIAKKQTERSGNPLTARCNIVIDMPMSQDDIPADGELVVVNSTANVSTGAEPVDVTDMVSEQVKSHIENAVNSIEGANCIGVDIITPSFTDPEKLRFIEFNTSAGFLIHLYPSFGTPRDFADAIADFMTRCPGPSMMNERELNEISERNAGNVELDPLLFEHARLRRQSLLGK